MAHSTRDSGWRRGLRTAGLWVLKALAVILPRLHRHARGLYSAVGLYLLVALGLAALALWGFAELAESVAEGETTRFDTAVLLWVGRHTSPGLDIVALEVTALANTLVIATVTLVSAAFLWFTRHRDAVFLLGAAVAGNAVLLQVLKLAFTRERPELLAWRAQYAGGYAFPSGHAMTAMVVYTTLAYLIIRLEPRPAVRRFTIALTTAIIVSVGLSRVYLAVHYPTDVLGGFAVGFAWAALAAFGLEVFHYYRDADAQDDDRAVRAA